MSLLGLPNELLSLVIGRLGPEDRNNLRKTCRRLHYAVDRVGLLPLQPEEIQIDFQYQTIVVFFEKKWYAVVNGDLAANEERSRLGKKLDQSDFLDRRLHMVCKVQGWDEYLHRYMMALARGDSQQNVSKPNGISEDSSIISTVVKTYKMSIILPPIGIPDGLIMIPSIIYHLKLRESTEWTSYRRRRIPKVLAAWLTKVSPTNELHLGLTLSPTHLDSVKTPFFSCLLKDDGALHLLNKFSGGNLPRRLKKWELFLNALQSEKNFLREIETRYPQQFASFPARPLIVHGQKVNLKISVVTSNLWFHFAVSRERLQMTLWTD